jgi:hypothetical protein
MTIFKLSRILPCSTFFAEGRIYLGLTALFMQFTLVLWPVAARWAVRTNEHNGVERLLAEFSEAHHVPKDPYAAPAKKFRQLA